MQHFYTERVLAVQIAKLKLSDGCISKFKHRGMLKNVQMHGEEDDADQNVAVAMLPSLRTKISTFARKIRFIADEFGLNYYIPADKTLTHHHLPGAKKERINELFCFKPDGTERYDRMFIGTVPKPPPFKKKSRREPRLDCHHRKKVADK